MKKKRITIDGLSIAYLQAGDGSKHLMLLHGNSLSSDSFVKQMKDNFELSIQFDYESLFQY
ncbi:hypothetical protein SAMN06265379_101609 [Saccharicrinis carchari]|uniref:Alpha/beta hydrolase n=1 Tax=Saccharicrinis carchari TaxID=1168039 RepID=A0A521B275_SACCC|nr:alpha/beta hydrolase [Saccharicrinis carchari]SMO41146.1 hypothetical protein SAMN06265379_101609 [Saccharicrinis carchari]